MWRVFGWNHRPGIIFWLHSADAVFWTGGVKIWQSIQSVHVGAGRALRSQQKLQSKSQQCTPKPQKASIVLSLIAKLLQKTLVGLLSADGSARMNMSQTHAANRCWSLSTALHRGLIKFYCYRFKNQLRGRSANLANRLPKWTRQPCRLAFVAKAALLRGRVSTRTDGYLAPDVSLTALLVFTSREMLSTLPQWLLRGALIQWWRRVLTFSTKNLW